MDGEADGVMLNRSGDEIGTPFVSFEWHGSIVNCIITVDQMGCLNVAKVHELTAVVGFYLFFTHQSKHSSLYFHFLSL